MASFPYFNETGLVSVNRRNNVGPRPRALLLRRLHCYVVKVFILSREINAAETDAKVSYLRQEVIGSFNRIRQIVSTLNSIHYKNGRVTLERVTLKFYIHIISI